MKLFTICRSIGRFSAAALVVNLAFAGSHAAQADRTILLDAGTVIPVRLNDPISSSDSRKGDTFNATVKTVDAEDYGLPSGTSVEGHCTRRPPS